MGCEPVLNLAATPDEAVSIICTIVDKTIPSTFLGEIDVCELYYYYWPARVFSRASWRCSSLNLSVGSFNMVDLCFMGCVVKMTLILESFNSSNVHAKYLGLGTSTHVWYWSINDHYIIKWYSSHAWYGWWTIKALVEAEVLYDGFTVSCRCIAALLIIARPLGVSLLINN